MPRTQVHEEGRPLSASPAFRAFLVAEVATIIWFVVWVIAQVEKAGGEPAGLKWGAIVYGLLMIATLVKSAGLWAGAMVWHRRLALLGVVAMLWRGSPLYQPWPQVIVVIEVTIIWIVYLLESKRVALAVAEATGEEVYRADPNRRPD